MKIDRLSLSSTRMPSHCPYILVCWQWITLLSLFASVTVVLASDAPTDCSIPRCCAQGHIVDPTGTRCLRDANNPQKELKHKMCRESFLPNCANEVSSSQSIGLGPKPGKHVKTEKVLKSLDKFVLRLPGGKEEMETYYSTHYNNKMAENMTASKSFHEIPAVFCIDPDNERALVCPKVKLDSDVTIKKCCPFGEQLKLPIYSGCEASDKNPQRQWTMLLEGRRRSLQDLIRFPYDFVGHDHDLRRRLDHREQCRGVGQRLLYDYEAFQVNTKGKLVYTRLLGPAHNYHGIDDFCVDVVSVNDKSHFMVAVFCQPRMRNGNLAPDIDEELLQLSLPSGSEAFKAKKTTTTTCFFALSIVCFVAKKFL